MSFLVFGVLKVEGRLVGPNDGKVLVCRLPFIPAPFLNPAAQPGRPSMVDFGLVGDSF